MKDETPKSNSARSLNRDTEEIINGVIRMNINRQFLVLALSAMLILTISFVAGAQDRSQRISPAFPIGAGEQMIVYPGILLSGSKNANGFASFGGFTSHINRLIHLDLPAGTTIKRLLGDFVDQHGSLDLTITLARYKNADASTKIVLRSFDTSGISSLTGYDFKQIVANPMSHAMLQGWTYVVEVEWPGGQNSGDLLVGAIKIIYEP